MRLPGKKKQQPPAPQQRPGAPGPQLRKRLKDAEKELEGLRRRLQVLEREVMEGRQLNKQMAELIDVVSEVLLSVEQRNEERLRALLKSYESTL
jgi:hypothetical protein